MDRVDLGGITKWAADWLKNWDAEFPGADEEKKVLRHLAKLTEEVGELSDAVLANFKVQRKEKIAAKNTELAHELADVVIVVFVLAKRLGIDMGEALPGKMEKINQRHKR